MRTVVMKLLVIAAFIAMAPSAFAGEIYVFDVNTASLNGQSGYLDLQFNPGISSTDAANAAVTGFLSDAALGVAVPSGGAGGVLPGVVTLSNTEQFNDYFQSLTFGSYLHFSLGLTGAAGNTFALSLFGQDGGTPLLTRHPDGFAAIIDLTETGAVFTNFSDQVSVSRNAVPEPATILLFGSGLAGLAGCRMRRRA